VSVDPEPEKEASGTNEKTRIVVNGEEEASAGVPPPDKVIPVPSLTRGSPRCPTVTQDWPITFILC